MAEYLTPLQEQQGVSDDKTFVDEVGAFLEKVEGKKPLPYLDDKGIPTVGIGINLTAYTTPYLDELGVIPTSNEGLALSGVFKKTYTKIIGYDQHGKPILGADDAAFQKALENAMQPYGAVSDLTLSDAKIEDLYDRVVVGDPTTGLDPNGNPAMLTKFKNFLKDNNISSDLLTSQEGLAIFSLFYNNAGTLLPPTGHLVPDLKNTGNDEFFNRADAWFQIRYGSNKGALTVEDPSNGQNGTAIRRDMESTIFGLYNAGDNANGTITAPLDESLAIYADLSSNTNGTQGSGAMTNRQYAFSYENRYGSLINSSPVGANAELHSLQPLIHTESLTQLTSLNVLSLDQILQPAAQTLLQHYITDTTLNRFAAGYAGDSVDALDVQVAQSGGGSDLVASRRSGYQLDTGSSYENSVLIAQGGDDTLDGSGSGNDALIGGSADDAIFVGSGDDYIVAGTGDDVIGSLSSSGMVGPMGSGNDTVVLGDPEYAKGGQDTVFSGSGADTYYLAGGDSDVVYLNSNAKTQPVFELVGAGGTPTALNLDASAETGTSGVYVDQAKNTLVLETPSANGTYSVKVIGLGSDGSSPQALTTQTESLAISRDAAAAQTTAPSLSGGFLELNNFQGTSDAGITLTSGNATTPGASNLGNFTATAYSDHTEYQDLSGTGGGDSMVGANTTGGNYNVLEGEGNASYIYAGNGNNDVFANDFRYSPVGEVFSNPLNVMVQGGSGDQLLVGMGEDGSHGNGKETIIGGAMGQDTTAWDTIEGGGTFVNALLVGGSQNSLIFGGLGTDTIVAGSATASSNQPDPTTIAMAGLSFWASSAQSAPGGGSETVTGEPNITFPAWTNPADFQIDLALNQLDGSYAAPFGLLGSAWDIGTDTSPWKDSSGSPISLPGSLMIGGGGEDYLIGNSGNDTIIGGTPSHPKAGVVDEVLVGGGGANLIYGGGGTELIFADLSAGGDANWANLDPSDADTIYGGTGNEYIYGSGGNDEIYGGSGNYTIATGNGNAYVEAGSGNTIVNGGSGNDTIIAGSGVDSIATGNGDDSVYGGDGQSTISLGSGKDTIEAGSGTTSYNAGTGEETYQVGLGAGNQTILGGTSASSINVAYTDGISSGEVVARCDTANDLILTDQVTGSQLEIDGYFNGESNVSISFSDGVTWGSGEILQASMTPDDGDDLLVGSNGNDTITGGPGNDTIIGVKGDNVLTGGTGNSTIYGGSGADTIEGGAGTNALYGGTGVETYLFNIGDGPGTITENASATGTDVLQFGSGIAASDVTFAHRGSSNDLLIQFGSDTASTVTVSNFLAAGQGGHQIGSFEFAGGTTLTAAQVVADASLTYVSDNGNDSIQGGPGNDTIYGGSGSDTLVGGPDDNLIIGGSGTESIVGGTGHNTLIGGSGNDTIVAGPNGDLIETGTGRALIETGAGNDTVEMTGGQDTLRASNGNDVYDFGIGSGQDSLTGAISGSDTLSFASGLTSQDLTFTSIKNQDPSQGDDLVVGIKGTKDSFTIQNYFEPSDGSAGGNPTVLFSFQDGSTLSYNQIQSLATQQADWNDTSNSITGNNPNNFQGEDTVPQLTAFDRGDGALALDPYWDLTASDVASGATQPLSLGQGIRPQDIVLHAQGDSVSLSIKGSGDSLFVPGLLDASVEGYALTSLSFSDGTQWDISTILQHVDYGVGALAAAGQIIDVANSGATVTPSGPNDTINAVDGVNLQFGYGDGDAILNLSAGPNGGGSGGGPENTLTLGPGITPNDVSVSEGSSGDKTVFTLKDTGESLTVLDADSSGSQVDLVQFADGSSWDDFNVASMARTGEPVEYSEAGTPSPALSQLPAGTTVLMGGLENSTLTGIPDGTIIIPGDGEGGGDGAAPPLNYTNNVLYGSGDGNATIEGAWWDPEPGDGGEGVAAANLEFQAGIAQSDITVSRTLDWGISDMGSGGSETFLPDGEGQGDLILTIAGTGKTITIPYAVYAPQPGSLSVSALPTVTFSDGSTLDLSRFVLGDTSDIAPSSIVAGTPGNETLQGAAGDTIGAAFGNTVELGSDQVVVAEGTPQLETVPPTTTYIFGSTTNADTINPNLGSTLQFAPGINESDVAVTGELSENDAAGPGEILYVKSTGAYVVLKDMGTQWLGNGTLVPDTLAFSDGKTYSLDAFEATSPYVTTDVSGVAGYYAETPPVDGDGMDSTLIVRGDVTNTVFGGNAWRAFDASASDVTELSPSMQAGIAASALTSPVVFTFDPNVAPVSSDDYDEISNYDANALVVKLPDGISPSDVSLSEQEESNSTSQDEYVSLNMAVKRTDGATSDLMIDGFLSGASNALAEKPLTIQFADGTTWDDSAIEQQVWQNGVDASAVYLGGIFLGQDDSSMVDLSHSGNGANYENVSVGNEGTNTIELGHDSVDASNGSNTFVVSASTDSIVTNFNLNQDIIQFAPGINPNDVEISQGFVNADASWAGTSLEYGYTFALRSTGQHLLTVGSNDFNRTSVLPIVQFSNGVTWTPVDLAGTAAVSEGQFADGFSENGPQTNYGMGVSQAIRGTTGDESLTGGAGDDQIAAGIGNDTISGGGGYDTLFAGQGNDTFVFGHGSGYDTIVPYGSGTYSNTVAFSSDVAPSDVSVVRPNSGNDLELVLNDSGEAVLLPDYLAGGASQSVQQVTFSDGTTWDAATLISMSHQGSAIAGYLAADSTAQSIAGGLGNDTLVGDANSDTLAAGTGNDLIESGDGANVIFTGAGRDTIYGGAGSDQIVMGMGDALAYGGTGAETYQFGTSFGHDTIFADPGEGGSNVIHFVDGINPSMVSFSSTSDGGVLISLDANGDSILLPDHYVNGSPVEDISQIVFDDGTTATMADIDQLLSQSGGAPVHYTNPATVITAGPGNVEITSDNGDDILVAGTGNDTLVGGSGADLMEAGSGNDVLTGGSGNETYAFATGFGQDDLKVNPDAASNTIRFDSGIKASDLTFQASGTLQNENLLMSVAGSVGGDGQESSLTLENHYVNEMPVADVSDLTFAGGTTLSMAEIDQGLASASSLIGTTLQILPGVGEVITVSGFAANTVTGGTGDDTLIGMGVSKELIAGSGNDLLDDEGGTGTLIGGSGNDTLEGHGGTLTAGSGNDTLETEGGTSTLIGGSGTDLLVDGPDAGYTTMEGGTGTETYEFGPAFRRATIAVASTENGVNTIQFLPGVTASQVTYAKSASNLLIKVTANGSTNQITLTNHFVNGVPLADDIGELTFADGTSVSMSQINQQFGGSAPAASGTQGASAQTTKLRIAAGETDDPVPPALHRTNIGPDSFIPPAPVLAPTGGDSPVPPASDPAVTTESGIQTLSQKSVVGAGDVVLPTVSTPSAIGGHQTVGLTQAHGTSGHELNEGRLPTAGAQPASGAASNMQTSSRDDDSDPHGSTIPTALKTTLGVSTDLESMQQNYSEAVSPSQGAPADPLASDPNDPALPDMFSHDTGNSWMPSSVLASTENDAFAPIFGQRGLLTAHAANEMVKALAAQGGLRSAQTGLDFGAAMPAGEIRLQGGAIWSMSATDRTLAALTDGDSDEHSGDLVHAQLISAMNSFAPAASAESAASLVPLASDTYAIAVAAQVH